MTLNQLQFFTVSGYYYDVEAPSPTGATPTPQVLVISAFVTFTPRLPAGTLEYITNLDLAVTIPPPASLTKTASTTGGTFAAGTYFWVVTALTPNGETTVSPEVTATLTGATSSVVLTWTPVYAATAYNVYRGTTSLAENKLTATIAAPTTTYTATGVTGSTVSPPTTNTAELSANTALAIAPITARILNGQLQTIDQPDTPTIQLLANTPILGLSTLIYDVAFTNVVYASKTQQISNFAFTAPTAATTIDLASPALTRLPYAPIGG